MSREPAGRGLAPAVLAGQQAALEREVRDVADRVVAAEGEDAVLVAPVDEAVAVLHRDDLDVPKASASSSSASVDVREAEPAHLARVDELLHRAERLGERRDAVGAVVVVEIDDVGAEALERAVDRAPDALGRAPGRSPGAQPNFVASTTCERRSPSAAPRKRSLSPPPYDSAVSKNVMPGVERRVDDPPRPSAVDPAAEVVAARARPARRRAPSDPGDRLHPPIVVTARGHALRCARGP